MKNLPASIAYSSLQSPPVGTVSVLAFQHAALVLTNLAYVVVIANGLSLGADAQLGIVSSTLLVCGMATVAQAYFGSRMLIIFHPNPIYIPFVLAAGYTHGLAGVTTLVLAAGITQFLLGSVVKKIRVLFPPEVCGVVIVMLGVSLLPSTLRHIIVAPDAMGPSNIDHAHLMIAITTLLAIAVFSVVLKGSSRAFALLFGGLAGLAAAYAMGDIQQVSQLEQASANWFSSPRLSFAGLGFYTGLLLIAAVGALVNVVDELGVLVSTERLENAEWQKPDFEKVRRGLQTSGLFTALSGLIGGVPLGMSSANSSLVYATGITSRIVATATGCILLAAAFLPAAQMLVLAIPGPIISGLIFFAASYFIVSGAELALSRMMSPRRALVIGVSLATGIVIQAQPLLTAELKGRFIEHVFSPMAFATLTAIALNYFARLGIRREQSLTIDSDDAFTAASERLEILGAEWGLTRTTVARARASLTEAFEIVSVLSNGPTNCSFAYDELNLTISIVYRGRAFVLPSEAPPLEVLLDEREGSARMSAWLLKRFSDSFTLSTAGDLRKVVLKFEC